mmetsp:Transcript_38264/g.46701  ORF Transcript_38264/g.46701 Transcript_38264/m.46701 type:complete len:395 (-) Transcript_38264:209-1393(-)|eukprot:CAMPEP_0172510390 /NCGR_PEP_ID=MMETSP1066-20121228/228087_1 /TAXON_ID=671091 /ORGANISM="Coscinodiscus wailesii, Strain CCMP2513" /LENGTH=394 /DNA_ID=CAMNT_0013289313 /DNA_START=97 /DNA_END=1281 /DNA_ORIENTATION=-
MRHVAILMSTLLASSSALVTPPLLHSRITFASSTTTQSHSETPSPSSSSSSTPLVANDDELHDNVVLPLTEMEKTKRLCAERNIPFECIKNARDLASVRDSTVKPGRVYRMGKISDASPSDVTALSELNIKTVVDLRSPTEWKEDDKLNDETVFGDYTTCIWRERNGEVKEGVMEPSRRNRMSSSAMHAHHEDSTRKERHFVSIMDEFKYVKGTLSKLRKRDIARVLLKSPGALFSRRVRGNVKDVFLNEINDGGLPMLNELLMRMGHPGIKYVLELVADVNRHPIAFYCTAGKDRTGMIAAIILAVAGVDDEAIVEDYALSANVYAEINDHKAMVGALSQRNLDPQTFLGAPPQVMRDTLESVKETYGSMDGYLNWIGFDEEKREELRKVLVE